MSEASNHIYLTSQVAFLPSIVAYLSSPEVTSTIVVTSLSSLEVPFLLLDVSNIF